MNGIIFLIFFLSGASALIFETLWFHLAGLSIGSTVPALSMTFTSFMAGLSIGNLVITKQASRIKSPLRVYAFLELFIGLSGVLIVFVFPHAAKWVIPLYQRLSPFPFYLSLSRAVFVFTMLIFPSIAMGATLPALVKALTRQNPVFGNLLGKLYGLNTLGAVVGVIACELLLIKYLGVKNTAVFSCGLNLFCFFSAYFLSRRSSFSDLKQEEKDQPLGLFSAWKAAPEALILSFTAGFCVLSLEVIWFRFMSLFFNAFSWFFALMLAMVLLGISLGGMIASRAAKKRRDFHKGTAILFLASTALIAIQYSTFISVLSFAKTHLNQYTSVFICSLHLILPVCLCSGMIYVFLGTILNDKLKGQISSAGILTLHNTLGAMFGSLLGGFFFIPKLGMEKSFFLIAGIYSIAFFICLLTDLKKQKKRSPFLICGYIIIALLCLFFFPFRMMEDTYMQIPRRLAELGGRRLALIEGSNETLQFYQHNILSEAYYYRLVTNHYTMSDTNLSSRRYMKYFVYLPVSLHPHPKKALLVCYGCGSTAKALTDTKSLTKIDIVDISKEIIQYSGLFFQSAADNPINDPRVRTFIDDGRFYLMATTQKYDLITSEPPPPKNDGVISLYTEEYFQLMYNRLNPGGMATYWLPISHLEFEEALSIIKAFADVFEDCSLWSGAGKHWILLGIKPPVLKPSLESFTAQWKDPVVFKELKALGFITPEQFGSFYIAGPERIKELTSRAKPTLDNYPQRLSYKFPPSYKSLKKLLQIKSINKTKQDFYSSDFIKKIWPKQMIEETAKYFSFAGIIDEMLIKEIRLSKSGSVKYLHECLNNPELRDYTAWALESNSRAQADVRKILSEQNISLVRFIDIICANIDSARKTGDSFLVNEYIFIGRHFAAAAVLEKKYQAALKYYSRAAVCDTFPEKYDDIFMQIYLLMLDEKKELAEDFKNKFYAFTLKTGRKDNQIVNDFWGWITKTFHAGRIGLPPLDIHLNFSF